MRDESLALLKELVEAGGPAGFEQPVQAIFRRVASRSADRVSTDVMGSVIAVRNPDGRPRLMFAGHADEIGFIVRYVNDQGYIYFAPVGSWDPEIVVGQRVTIHTATGPVRGVIGKRAIHLMDEEDRKKRSELHALWIDIGLEGRAAVEEIVKIGDPITMAQTLEHLQGDLAVAKSFDNRMAVFILAETLRLLEGTKLTAGVYGVSTVQEEIGRRGAQTSTFGIDPQVGIALDVCHAVDYPGADKRKVGDIALGRGPVIARGANINPRVFELLLQVARDESIPHQVEAAPRDSGTDAHAMQVTRAGVATGVVAVPLRYMHTPCEVLSLVDLENACRLCAGFAARLTEAIDWTP